MATMTTTPGPEAASTTRVLVVDDYADNAQSMETLLKLFGFEVDVALNGPAALTLADEHPPRVALIDLGMPGMDGYEVCRRLRAKLGDRVLLVAVTAWGFDEDRARSLTAGFDLHLVKPADPDVLLRVLRTAT
jgi:CheY-like chemotaxis protein